MVVSLWLLTIIITLGHEKGTPVLGFRLKMIRFIYPIYARVAGLFLFGTWFSMAYEKADYSKYLGVNELEV
jgi:hypothetical protein